MGKVFHTEICALDYQIKKNERQNLIKSDANWMRRTIIYVVTVRDKQ